LLAFLIYPMRSTSPPNLLSSVLSA
jgi:hypothetical protein